jgi:hypothetical protein
VAIFVWLGARAFVWRQADANFATRWSGCSQTDRTARNTSQAAPRSRAHISTRQFTPIVRHWINSIGVDDHGFGTPSLRRTKVVRISCETAPSGMCPFRPWLRRPRHHRRPRPADHHRRRRCSMAPCQPETAARAYGGDLPGAIRSRQLEEFDFAPMPFPRQTCWGADRQFLRNGFWREVRTGGSLGKPWRDARWRQWRQRP